MLCNRDSRDFIHSQLLRVEVAKTDFCSTEMFLNGRIVFTVHKYKNQAALEVFSERKELAGARDWPAALPNHQ